MLAILQKFDPPGVCARNLTECLAIQLRERDRFDPACRSLVAHLELLAKRDLAALRRVCGVDDEDLAEMIAEIRSLNPKPGLAFGSTTVQPIVPDVMVRAAPDGTWQVDLNSDTLPKVLINQRYYAKVSKGTKNDKDKTYIADCLQTATWLVRALDQRAKTILKVSSEIVRQQDGFFVHGVQHLRPLNLKTVADAIGMHESTVSRVTANKYMATSRGIFELKYFFTSAIAAADGGEAHSAEAVRHRIRQLIDGETRRRRSLRRYHRREAANPPVSTLRAAPWRNIAKRCAFPPRCSAGARSRRLRRKHAALRREQTELFPFARLCERTSFTVGRADRFRRPPRPHRLRVRLTPAAGSQGGNRMPLRVSGKNISVGMALQQRISGRVEEATAKYFRGGYSGFATVGKDGFGFRTECVLHLDSGRFDRSRGPRTRCL